MIKGIEVNLMIYRDNDEDLSCEDFESIMNDNGLVLGGSIIEIDEEGERYNSK